MQAAKQPTIAFTYTQPCDAKLQYRPRSLYIGKKRLIGKDKAGEITKEILNIGLLKDRKRIQDILQKYGRETVSPLQCPQQGSNNKNYYYYKTEEEEDFA